MSIWSNIGKSLGAGAVGAGAGFLLGGPVGAAAGFGVGVLGSAMGMAGKGQMGGLAGGAIGGIAGFAIGGPIGALVGGMGGAMFGGAIGNAFNQPPQPPPYAGGFPPMMGGGFGMMPGGCGFPGGGFGFGGGAGLGCFGGMMMPMPFNMFAFNQQCCYPPQQQPAFNGGGQLEQKQSGGPINYTTQGGYKVTINKDAITIVDPAGKHTVTHSGDPHEYVDGKHIKDWEDKNRTIILGDGTRITMNADSPTGVTKHTSIYDGAEQVQINNDTNSIEKVSFNPYETMKAQQSQVQGETSYLGYRDDGSFIYKNIYKQSADGNFTTYHKDLFSDPPKCQRRAAVSDYEFLQQ